MQLQPLMTYSADLLPGVDVGAGPRGHRQFFQVSGGSFEGPRLRGRILPGGGDWLLVDAEGIGHLDVRAIFETHDGARIYVQYFGRLEITEGVLAALGGKGETRFGDQHFFSQPRFETGDERYRWLNRVLAVGQGRALPNRVEYQVFAFAN